jgi:hypothetical protein
MAPRMRGVLRGVLPYVQPLIVKEPKVVDPTRGR